MVLILSRPFNIVKAPPRRGRGGAGLGEGKEKKKGGASLLVLKSKKDNKLYIGYTNNLKKRIQEHNKGRTFSTAYRGTFFLVYYESFKSQKDAVTREKQLKQFKSAYGHLKKRIQNSLHES